MAAWRSLVATLALALALVALGASADDAFAFAERHRRGLINSTWPADHADNARAKFSLTGGLPAETTRVRFVLNDRVKAPLFVYTGGQQSEFLYVIHAPSEALISKLNATTLDILQQFTLPPTLYAGGLLMHESGHVFCAVSNRLYRFWQGDLNNATVFDLPHSLNGVVFTNGMLTTHAGLLVIKQFSPNLLYLGLVFAARSAFLKALVAVVVVAIVTLRLLSARASGGSSPVKPPKTLVARLAKEGRIVAFGVLIGGALWFLVLMLMLRVKERPFSVVRFFTDALLSPNAGGGELKLVDPHTMKVRASAQLPERCSYGRMAMTTRMNAEGDEEDVIILLGDENIHQYRWNARKEKLYWIKAWSREYRREFDGSFPGTGPSIYDDVTYFTDNTYPVFLFNSTYTMFSLPIDRALGADGNETGITSEHYTDADTLELWPSNRAEHFNRQKKLRFPPAPRVPVLPNATDPGYMFWSVTIGPQLSGDASAPAGVAIVWDSLRFAVQGRDLRNISSVVWEVPGVRQFDCIAAAPASGHVYFTDVTSTPRVSTRQIAYGFSDAFVGLKDAVKQFIVADLYTGKTLLNVTLPGSVDAIGPSMIIPGARQDVFVGTSGGMVRVVADTE